MAVPSPVRNVKMLPSIGTWVLNTLTLKQCIFFHTLREKKWNIILQNWGQKRNCNQQYFSYLLVDSCNKCSMAWCRTVTNKTWNINIMQSVSIVTRTFYNELIREILIKEKIINDKIFPWSVAQQMKQLREFCWYFMLSYIVLANCLFIG